MLKTKPQKIIPLKQNGLKAIIDPENGLNPKIHF
jgi:hypothetical protein